MKDVPSSPMPMVPQPPIAAKNSANRLLLTLWLTTALSLLGIALVAALAWRESHPLVLDSTFLARFSLDAYLFYPQQPGKSVAYEFACILFPPILAACYFAARLLVGRLGDSILSKALRIAVGVSWVFFLWCISPMAYCPHPPLEGMSPDWLLSKWFFVRHPFFIWPRFLYFGLCCGIAFFLFRRRARHANRRLALVALLIFWAALVPSDIYTRDQIDDDWRFTYHFNVLTHALSQVIGGHHFLIDFSHIYGGYVEFLGPILALFPRRIETLLLVFPLLHAVAVLALLLTVRLIIRNGAVLFLTGLALLALEYMLPIEDHYYSYNPIRTLFSTLGLLGAILFFQKPTRLQYAAVSCLTAVAPLWNLDTGAVLWLSWTATLGVVRLGEDKPLRALRELAIQSGALVAATAAFLVYLRIVSGIWPDPRDMVAFQMFVTGSGFMCLAMLVPDVWILIITTYVVGLAVAFHFGVTKAASWKTHTMVMLSLLGIGLFSYFTGRSSESALASASYPAILLIGFLFSEATGLLALKKLPRPAWALLFPFGLMVAWWALVFSLALPDLLAASRNVLLSWNSNAETPFQTNVAFLQKWIQPGERVFILSNHSGFYYYLTDTVCPVVTPGPGEWGLTADMDRQVDYFSTARFPKLFVEGNFYTVGTYKAAAFQRIQDAIARHYRAAATSPTGQITLYVPR